MKDEDRDDNWTCDCVGPQDDEPYCPCQMRNVKVKHGRYIEEVDLGPAAPKNKRQLLQE